MLKQSVVAVGIGMMTFGAWMFDPRAGLIVAGWGILFSAIMC
jgi:hypothetical protein